MKMASAHVSNLQSKVAEYAPTFKSLKQAKSFTQGYGHVITPLCGKSNIFSAKFRSYKGFLLLCYINSRVAAVDSLPGLYLMLILQQPALETEIFNPEVLVAIGGTGERALILIVRI
jgi:hypothetical protein